MEALATTVTATSYNSREGRLIRLTLGPEKRAEEVETNVFSILVKICCEGEQKKAAVNRKRERHMSKEVF